MIEIAKKYRFLITMQLPIIVLLAARTTPYTLLQRGIFCAVAEVVIILSFLKYRYDLRNQHNIIRDHNNKLIIRGVFGKKEISKEAILKLEIRSSFITRVFDWSQIIITTQDQKMKVYTPRIVSPAVLQIEL